MTEKIAKFDRKQNQWIFPDGIVVTKAEVEEVYSYLCISDRQFLEKSTLNDSVEPEIRNQLYSLKKKIQEEEETRRAAEERKARQEEAERIKAEEIRKLAIRQQYLVYPISNAVLQYKKKHHIQ